MKDLNIENLRTDLIKKDDFFDISSHRFELLQYILNITGYITCPLWVLRSSNGLILVDGYSRLKWAQGKGLSSVPCLIFSESFSTLSLLIRKVYATLSNRNLDIIEKAKFVARLSSFLEPSEIKERFFGHLSIPRKPRMYKTLIKIAELPDKLLDSVVKGNVSEKSLVRLVWWDEKSRRDIFQIFSLLKCSVSTQIELIELLEDLSRLKEKPPYQIMEELFIQDIVNEESLTPKLKSEKIRFLLKKELFPNLTRKEESLKRLVKSLSLPKTIKIENPPFFEGDIWKLTINFSNASELKDSLTFLLKEKFVEKLSPIIEPRRKEYLSDD